MNQLPEFWRTEVWHPLSVHFPIALLLMAFFFKAIALISKKEVWPQGGSILLYAGIVGAWVAVYTGSMADGAVARTLCDPTALKDHENAAYAMAWIFSAGGVFEFIYLTGLLPLNKTFQKILVIIILLVGNGFLVYVGHSGATLVYQQGAGVYKPSSDCAEF